MCPYMAASKASIIPYIVAKIGLLLFFIYFFVEWGTDIPKTHPDTFIAYAKHQWFTIVLIIIQGYYVTLMRTWRRDLDKWPIE